jgi:hypothetical protein
MMLIPAATHQPLYPAAPRFGGSAHCPYNRANGTRPAFTHNCSIHR